MAEGGAGMSGRNFDAFVSSQRGFNDYDLTAKIQEKYWLARQKFLAKVEKNEDSNIVLSDSKLDAKLDIYKSIDKSCARLINILENYQNNLFIYSNDENSLGILLKECGKHDKTQAGKIMSVTGKSLTQSSHQRIRLYVPLMRMYQEIETFHSRAVEDTSETVSKLESKRSKYRASLLWLKDISEKLDPDVYRQLERFRRVQTQVKNEKKAFDLLQADVVQKIDLLMASRCNLMNQILASYQVILLETLEKNANNLRSVKALIEKEDIHEYEFKVLKQLNPLKICDDVQEQPEKCDDPTDSAVDDTLIDLSADTCEENKWEANKPKLESIDLLDMNVDDQVANLLEPSENKAAISSNRENLFDLENESSEQTTKDTKLDEWNWAEELSKISNESNSCL